jgi:hypothetical protein
MAYQKYRNKSFSLRYEDLITKPTENLKKLFKYLALPYNANILSSFDEVKLKGQWGDPTGVKQYKSVSKEPLEKWRQILTNPIRKLWCQHYMLYIGEKNLSIIGYDLNYLLVELKNNKSNFRKVVSDLSRIIFGIFYCALDPRLLKHKLQILPDWKKVHWHK